ncbi:MAG: FkbM family methyltransferase [Synergistaceae bacterium]|nr:FkbM family methyltransferase [Synergistaceae bacterium]
MQADSIDNLLGDEPVSFIKVDIEGAELKALHGAARTIVSKRPKLAVCAYHRAEDLITIPQYIRTLLPDARFYFRSHMFAANEPVLYAVC